MLTGSLNGIGGANQDPLLKSEWFEERWAPLCELIGCCNWSFHYQYVGVVHTDIVAMAHATENMDFWVP